MSVYLHKRLANLVRSKFSFGTSEPELPPWLDTDDFFAENSTHSQPHPPPTEEDRHFAVLELAPGAGFAEIQSAYRRLSRKYHPDRFASDPEKFQIASQVQVKLNEAFDYFKTRKGK